MTNFRNYLFKMLKVVIANLYFNIILLYCCQDIKKLKKLVTPNILKLFKNKIDKQRLSGLFLNIEFATKLKLTFTKIMYKDNKLSIDVKFISKQFEVFCNDKGQELDETSGIALDVEDKWRFETHNQNTWLLCAINQ